MPSKRSVGLGTKPTIIKCESWVSYVNHTLQLNIGYEKIPAFIIMQRNTGFMANLDST